MKRHSCKGYAGFLYYIHRVKSGNAWKMTQLLGLIFLKKLTPIIRFTETSLLRMKLMLTSMFPTGCLFNRSLVPISTSFGLNKLLFVLLLAELFAIKPLVLS
jgi:hypothetical protein